MSAPRCTPKPRESACCTLLLCSRGKRHMAQATRLERLIIEFDRGLRTLFAPAHGMRQSPAQDRPEPALEQSERALSAALMRVNHSGEVCAQALYQGQAISARNADTARTL